MTLIGSFLPIYEGFAATPISISVNTTKVIGTNNLSLGFQLDGDDIRIWRDSSVLQQLASNASLKIVRFFEQRLGSPCTSWNTATKTGTWDWSKIDPLIKNIFAIGAQPLIVLGFIGYSNWQLSTCPRGMPLNTTTGLPQPDQWAAYTAAWVSHFKSKGYPVRYYELINEAYHYFGWPATQPKLGYFMQLYNSAYASMKAVNPNVQIGNDACVLKSVLNYFITNGKPLDFLSYHAYGATIPSTSDSTIFQNAETLYVNETLRVYGVDEARKVYKAAKGVWLPVMHDESNLDYYFTTGTDPRIQEMQGAVYNALTFRTGMLDNFSYISYFHFASSATNNPQGGLGFGMVNLDNNKPYYPYYAFQMVGSNLAVGDKLVQCSSTSSNIRVVAWTHQNKLNLLIISKVDSATSITLQGLSGQLQYYKIDNTISWKTPKVQQGTVSSTSSLTINGYTVMLLQAVVSS